MADRRGAVHELIRRGRLRQVSHLAIHAASFAGVVALGGMILLLVVGAQILSWYWIALLFAVGLAGGAYRLRAELRSSYQVAQAIDRELGFYDALSTAYYFGDHRDRAPAPEFVDGQRRVAEDLARSADLRRGVPFRMPRSAYVNLALAAVALGMFGLRYGVERSLDLGSPLVHIRFDGLFGNSQVAERRGSVPGDRDGQRDPGVEQWNANTNERDPAADAARQSVEDPEASNTGTSPDGAAKADATNNQQLPPGTNPLDSGEKGASSQPSDQNANASQGADSKSGQQNASKNDKEDGKGDSKEANQSGNSSLASKLRDALSNLLAKMKPQSNQPGGSPNDSSQSAGTRNPQADRQDGAPKSPGQEQADAGAESRSEGEQQQGGTQQASQGKSEGRSNSQPNSPDGKSGIGRQDGDKAAREAAELAAMGKISEIIGKRTANISGEMMVEVSPGKQQLKTQYSEQNATHADTGGEINRDEVPLAYQQYVEQYFAQIRKLPAGKPKPGADAKPDAAPDAKTKPAPSSLP